MMAAVALVARVLVRRRQVLGWVGHHVERMLDMVRGLAVHHIAGVRKMVRSAGLPGPRKWRRAAAVAPRPGVLCPLLVGQLHIHHLFARHQHQRDAPFLDRRGPRGWCAATQLRVLLLGQVVGACHLAKSLRM